MQGSRLWVMMVFAEEPEICCFSSLTAESTAADGGMLQSHFGVFASVPLSPFAA